MDKKKTEAPYVEFGNRLREFREKEYNTQTAFAEAIGIEAARYRQYELGNRRPDYEILLEIADVLDVTTDELLGRDSRESKIERIVDEVASSFEDKQEVVKHKALPEYEEFYYLWDEAEELRDKYLRRRIRETWEDKCRKIDLKNEHKLHMPMLRGIAGAIGIQFDIFDKYCYEALYNTDVATPFELLLFIYFSGFDPYSGTKRDIFNFLHKRVDKPKTDWDEIDGYLAVSMIFYYIEALEKESMKYCKECEIDTEVIYSDFPKEFFNRCMEYKRPKEKRVDWVEEIAAEFLDRNYAELAKKEKADETKTVFMALKKEFFSKFAHKIEEEIRYPVKFISDELYPSPEVLKMEARLRPEREKMARKARNGEEKDERMRL